MIVLHVPNPLESGGRRNCVIRSHSLFFLDEPATRKGVCALGSAPFVRFAPYRKDTTSTGTYLFLRHQLPTWLHPTIPLESFRYLMPGPESASHLLAQPAVRGAALVCPPAGLADVSSFVSSIPRVRTLLKLRYKVRPLFVRHFDRLTFLRPDILGYLAPP